MEPFRDRADAGRRLAEALSEYHGRRPVVLGLARGGVVVAAEVAKALEADLDVFVARKVGAPSNPEYGIGAVAPEGARYFDEAAVDRLNLSPVEMDRLARREEQEMQRRIAAYRGGRPMPELDDRVAILVDDGLATGVTAAAAAMALRHLRPATLVFASPVCAEAGIARLRAYVDEVVCLGTPKEFASVGQWYETFGQTSDGEVAAILGLGI